MRDDCITGSTTEETTVRCTGSLCVLHGRDTGGWSCDLVHVAVPTQDVRGGTGGFCRPDANVSVFRRRDGPSADKPKGCRPIHSLRSRSGIIVRCLFLLGDPERPRFLLARAGIRYAADDYGHVPTSRLRLCPLVAAGRNQSPGHRPDWSPAARVWRPADDVITRADRWRRGPSLLAYDVATPPGPARRDRP